MNTQTKKVGTLARLKSGFYRWLGMPLTLYDEASNKFWAYFYGGMSHSGENVTVDKALQLSTVWACVRLISDCFGMMPAKLYRTTREGVAVEARDHPLWRIIHRSPNADMTPMQFFQACVACLLLHGFIAVEVERLGGRIVALTILIPQRLQRRRRENGSIETKYQDYNGKTRTIPEDDLLWIPFMTMDGITPLTPIQYACNVMGNAISAEKVAGKTFKNGLVSTFVLQMDKILKKEQRKEMREDFLETVMGAVHAGKPMILEAGMKAEVLSLNPTDAQLLESRTFSVEEICRWFGVPPHLVGHTEKQTSFGSGVEEQKIGFLTFCIQPIVTRVEQGLERRLLTETEQKTHYIEFLLDVLLRADMKTRAAFYSTMSQNGIMTRDECRGKENLPTQGGNAAILTVQSNLVPLDKLGETPAAQTAIDAIKSALGLDGKDEVEGK